MGENPGKIFLILKRCELYLCCNNSKVRSDLEVVNHGSERDKTESNLMTHCRRKSGPCQEEILYYASRAKKDGYERIAALFTETSDNEKEHAKLWFKLLHGGEVPGTAGKI